MVAPSDGSPAAPPVVPEPSSRPPERAVVLLLVGVVLLYALWTLRDPGAPPAPEIDAATAGRGALSPERMPLVTGDESITDIFTRAGCVVCHIIPGISGANGQVGPRLVLGTTGAQRLRDPSYQGEATTIREYILESVLDPRRFVVQGYPDQTMPPWYGLKLSALALERIAVYLERQTEGEETP